MALTLKHDTSDYTIETSNCVELKDALVANGWIREAVQREKKADLVKFAMSDRDTLKAKYDAEQAALEEARLVKIADEKAEGKYAAGCAALATAFRDQYNGSLNLIKGFQERVAAMNPETNDLVSELEWKTDDVFGAYARMSQFVGLARFFEKQLEEPAYTIEELEDHLTEWANDVTESVLRISTSQSTNPIYNVRKLEELKAESQKAQALRQVVKYFGKIFGNDPSYGRYVCRF